MATLQQQAADNWINDHLDLYNYAVQIGDTEWQEEILGALRAKDEQIRLLANTLALQELWSRFDTINRMMLELYERLRTDENAANKQHLHHAVWELKRQRVSISNQIRGFSL